MYINLSWFIRLEISVHMVVSNVRIQKRILGNYPNFKPVYLIFFNKKILRAQKQSQPNIKKKKKLGKH